MKKISVLLIVVLFLSSCAEKEMDGLGEPQSDKVQVEGSTVEEETSIEDKQAEKVNKPAEYEGVQYDEVVNKWQYEGFSDIQIEKLNKDGFIVMEQNEDDFIEDRYHSGYEMANYTKRPVYVTTDSVLNAFDIFYSGSMMNLELTRLYFDQADLVNRLIMELVYDYDENNRLLSLSNNEGLDTADVNLVEPFEDAIAYLYTASRLFMEKEIEFVSARGEDKYYAGERWKALKVQFAEVEAMIPERAREISDVEYARVMGAGGLEKSDLFGYDIDYSQFKPRGHYTASSILENYFKGMMWLGNPGLELEDNERATRLALILACELYSSPELMKVWDDSYDITAYYSSASDDVNVHDLEPMIKGVLDFDNVWFKNVVSDELSDAITEEIKKLRDSKIKPSTFEGSTNELSTKKQFRFMGQRYNADQFILSKLLNAPEKPFVSSLEFFGILGNDKAKQISDDMYHFADMWEGYEEKYQFTKDIYNIKKDVVFADDMYHNYLKVIDLCLNNPVDKDNPNLPKFMKTDAYDYMRINSALGGFAQLKHANVLYSKQVAAEMGGAEPKTVKHYIEPNPELYEELARTLREASKKMEELGISEDGEGHRAFNPTKKFADYLDIFASASRKELAGEDLDDEELMTLGYFGGLCDAMADDVAFLNYRTGIEVDTKLVSRPVISDIATTHAQDGGQDLYLELGIGMPLDIYVLVEQNGEKVLAKGTLFSAYEFFSDERLTDEAWDEMICERADENEWRILGLNDDMKLTKRMPYTKHFVSEEKNGVKLSEEALNW